MVLRHLDSRFLQWVTRTAGPAGGADHPSRTRNGGAGHRAEFPGGSPQRQRGGHRCHQVFTRVGFSGGTWDMNRHVRTRARAERAASHTVILPLSIDLLATVSTGVGVRKLRGHRGRP